MSISSENRKAGPYTGNGVATVFPFSFKVFGADDVRVVVADTDGTESDLSLGTDFTATINSDQDSAPGGSVTLPAALASGYTLIVTSSIEQLQPVVLTNNGGFYPSVINNALDRLTILVQQLAEGLKRVVTFPITDTSGANSELPSASVRKGAVLAFDETSGSPIVGPSIASVGTVAANTAAISTTAAHIDAVIDAPNQASAAAASAEAAAVSADTAQAWAESTGAPGAAGTKSSKSWATQAQAWAESSVAPGDTGTKSAKSWAADAKEYAEQISSSAVLSVNGKTGNAVLGATDVGALSSSGGTVSGGLAVSGALTNPSTTPASFGARPSFGGNTPWDSGNLNPGNYLSLAGGTVSGGLAVGNGFGVSGGQASFNGGDVHINNGHYLYVGDAAYQNDGNINGSLWGGYLNNYISNALGGKFGNPTWYVGGSPGGIRFANGFTIQWLTISGGGGTTAGNFSTTFGGIWSIFATSFGSDGGFVNTFSIASFTNSQATVFKRRVMNGGGLDNSSDEARVVAFGWT